MSNPWKRREVIGNATLYLGDCIEVLHGLRDGCQNVDVSVEQGGGADIALPTRIADAVITDPPYGIGFKYESHIDDADAYPNLMRGWIGAVTADSFFVWQAIQTADKWHTWFPAGYRILASCKNFTQYRPTEVQFGWDPIIYWRTVKGDKAPAGVRDWHIANTAAWITGEKWGHPCPRPIDAVEWVCRLAGESATSVLDPFMGSGTTGVACAKLGRKFIGVEIEEKYFSIACHRIEEAYRQPRLFSDVAPKPTQEKML